MFKKKIIGFLLATTLILSSTMSSFATTQSDISNNKDINELIPSDVSESSKLKIYQDISALENVGLLTEYINKIEVRESEDSNIYYFKYKDIKYNNYPTETVTIIKNNDNSYEINISQGTLTNKLLIENDILYVDGKNTNLKIDVNKGKKSNLNSKEQVTPMADRDIWSVKNCPYGTASDYNTLNNASYTDDINVPLTTALRNVTIGLMTSLLIANLGPAFGELEGVLISMVLDSIKASFSPSTTGLSYKNFVYFHKNGWYVPSKNMYIHKNNTRWYEGINFTGTSKVIPTYTCKILY